MTDTKAVPALLRALNEGWIAGGGLDAHSVEPLPTDSPFWTARNSIVTPHNGASTPFTRQRAHDIVCENLGVNKEQVTRKTSFIEDVGADSLDIVELIMELEEEFEINIPDEQAEKIKTVGEAIEYIEREIAKK